MMGAGIGTSAEISFENGRSDARMPRNRTENRRWQGGPDMPNRTDKSGN